MTYTARELLANGVDELVVRVRAWRRAKRLTQDEFAELIGLHPQTVAATEVGRLKLSRPIREKYERFAQEQGAPTP